MQEESDHNNLKNGKKTKENQRDQRRNTEIN